ncbi:C-type lectin domain family 6 member A-like [Polymixia lowei]
MSGLCSKGVLVLLAVLCLVPAAAHTTVAISYVKKSNQSDSLEAQDRKNFIDCKACPDGWLFYGRKCYFLSTVQMNWPESRDHCISMGAHLVIITSEDEQRFLNSTETRWIGLNDIETEGKWVWVNNEPLNPNVQFWFQRSQDEQDEPDNWKGADSSGENCAAHGNEMTSTNMWFDASCKTKKKMICEGISAI